MRGRTPAGARTAGSDGTAERVPVRPGRRQELGLRVPAAGGTRLPVAGGGAQRVVRVARTAPPTGGHGQDGDRQVRVSARRRRSPAGGQRGVLADGARGARLLRSELHGGRARLRSGDVRRVFGSGGNPVPRARAVRGRRLRQHVLQRARPRAPVAGLSAQAVGPRFRRRDRGRLSAGFAGRPALPRRPMAAGGPARPQHVRADVGPLPAGERFGGGGPLVSDPEPDAAVRGPAGRPAGGQRVSGRVARRPPRRAVRVLGRVDRLRARRPAEPQLHGGVRGPGRGHDGVQVAGSVQTVGEAGARRRHRVVL